ncbi:MAG: ribosomal-processing cysteine protease Prp [bacterium]
MTEIYFHRSNSSGEIIGISARGHSGDASEGESIVCAGISTVFELLLAGAKNLPAPAVKFEQDNTRASQQLMVEPEKLEKQQWSCYRNMLRAASEVLEKIAENHPEFCSIADKTA